jgi:hypothetical protein
MPTPDTPDAHKRRFPLVTAIVVVAFVGLGIGYVTLNKDAVQSTDVEISAPEKVIVGDLYYVFVETVEYAPKQADNESWDLDESAPDVAYQITWKGQTIFESTELSDTLIGRWSGMKLGLDQALSLLKNGKTDPAQIIDAALMRAERDGSFSLTFEDSDLAGADTAGEFTIRWEDVNVGTHVLTGPLPGQGVITATLRVAPNSSDLFKVVRALSQETP